MIDAFRTRVEEDMTEDRWTPKVGDQVDCRPGRSPRRVSEVSGGLNTDDAWRVRLSDGWYERIALAEAQPAPLRPIWRIVTAESPKVTEDRVEYLTAVSPNGPQPEEVPLIPPPLSRALTVALRRWVLLTQQEIRNQQDLARVQAQQEVLQRVQLRTSEELAVARAGVERVIAEELAGEGGGHGH
jgi:hypothetical protein